MSGFAAFRAVSLWLTASWFFFRRLRLNFYHVRRGIAWDNVAVRAVSHRLTARKAAKPLGTSRDVLTDVATDLTALRASLTNVLVYAPGGIPSNACHS